MAYRVLADVTVILHTLFAGFVVLGGLATLRWPQVAWAHVPAALWGVAIEFGGWTCPLTPLENALRLRAGQAGYAGGFVTHYLVPVLYPMGLTPPRQMVLGAAALVVNGLFYSILVGRALRGKRAASPHSRSVYDRTVVPHRPRRGVRGLR
jgi:hypothetical protein